jgi:hypothetical protein
MSCTIRSHTRVCWAIVPVAAVAMVLAACTGSNTPDTSAITSTSRAAPPSTAPPTSAVTRVPIQKFAGCPAANAVINVCNGRFDIPAWDPNNDIPQCPLKAVQFTNGRFPKISPAPDIPAYSAGGVEKFVTADVTGDGRADAVVILTCHIGDPPTDQVMAVSQESSRILRTLGQVVGPTHGDVTFIEDIEVDRDGSIRAEVISPHGSRGGGIAQWRTYRWDGNQFIQTAGPSSF